MRTYDQRQLYYTGSRMRTFLSALKLLPVIEILAEPTQFHGGTRVVIFSTARVAALTRAAGLVTWVANQRKFMAVLSRLRVVQALPEEHPANIGLADDEQAVLLHVPYGF